MNEQIEKMAKTLCSDYGDCERCIVENPESETICTVWEHCKVLYNAGYRKITFCKDCSHWSLISGMKRTGFCLLHKENTRENGFCDFGER
jgi:hypothetical protein